MHSDEPYPLTLEPAVAELFRGRSASAFSAEEGAAPEFTAGTVCLAAAGSRVAAGPQAGRGLSYLRQIWGAALLGSLNGGRPDEPLPLELKLKSTGESALAVALTEDSLWYILAAEDDASLKAGFLPGLDFAEAGNKAGDDPGRWSEFMPEYSVEAGACLHLPKMAPLLLGAGLTAAQIGPPARHLEAWPLAGRGVEALALAAETTPPVWLEPAETGPDETLIFNGPRLTVRLISSARRSDLAASDAATFIWPLSGQGRILTGGPAPTTRLQPGRVVLLPAAQGRYTVESGGTVSYLLLEYR